MNASTLAIGLAALAALAFTAMMIAARAERRRRDAISRANLERTQRAARVMAKEIRPLRYGIAEPSAFQRPANTARPRLVPAPARRRDVDDTARRSDDGGLTVMGAIAAASIADPEPARSEQRGESHHSPQDAGQNDSVVSAPAASDSGSGSGGGE